MRLETIARLESRRRAALAEQDGSAYVRLCGELGVPPEDVFLYEQGLVRSSRLQTLSVPSVFGFTKKSLDEFSYSALRTIFFGMHAIDIPPNLMAELNPAEILAKYYGTRCAKQRRVPFSGAGFSALVRLLDGLAYKNPEFRAAALKLPAPYPTDADAQQKRLAFVDDTIKKAFVRSFLAPSRSFHDPNYDGHDKRLYVNAAYAILKTAYEQL